MQDTDALIADGSQTRTPNGTVTSAVPTGTPSRRTGDVRRATIFGRKRGATTAASGRLTTIGTPSRRASLRPRHHSTLRIENILYPPSSILCAFVFSVGVLRLTRLDDLRYARAMPTTQRKTASARVTKTTIRGDPSWSRLLIVEGTSGVGKSTLIDRLIRRYVAE